MGNGVSVPPELPYQSYSTYNGKILQPLSAVDEQQLKRIHCGVWSESVPDQLRLIIRQPERYREAISIINTVSLTKVRFRSYWSLLLIAIGLTLFPLVTGIGIGLLGYWSFWKHTEHHQIYILSITGVTFLLFFLHYISLVKSVNRRIVLELQKAVCQANNLLIEDNILMGAVSNSQLLLVYVCLDGCRQELSALSQNQGLFSKAIQDYSSAYTSCLAKRRFPFRPVSNTNHLEGTLCFCQFVIRRLYMEKCLYCCSKQQIFAGLETTV